LANYIGSFVEYDKNNKGSFWREYMRIRVRVDIRQPLKKDSRVKNQGGNWCTVNFKYEKLGVLCFVCGLIGHGENRCAVRFSLTEDDGSRGWSKDLRDDPRRRSGRKHHGGLRRKTVAGMCMEMVYPMVLTTSKVTPRANSMLLRSTIPTDQQLISNHYHVPHLFP
jgi:hypothetical protein